MARKPMTDRKEISFTVGEQTHGIVQRNIVEKTDKYDSAKEFYEVAVRNNARTLQKLSAGGKQARDLGLLLGKIRGITVQVPEDDAGAFILDGELAETRPRIELSPERMHTLSEIQLETGLSRSEVIRRCAFRQMNQLAHNYGLVRGWRKEEIQKVWEEAEAGLKRPRLQCYDVLQRRFVDETKRTEHKIEEDPPGFERFAEEYVDKFHESKAYNQLLEDRPERPLRMVEDTIAEYSNHSTGVEAPRSGFPQVLQSEVRIDE